MTGFGRSQGQFNSRKITIEIRSLNSRQLDLNMRLHSAYKEKEYDIRSVVAKQIERGKVDFSIYVDEGENSQVVSLNKTLAAAYYKELKQLAAAVGEPQTDYMKLLVMMPEVLKSERLTLPEDEWEVITKLMNEAIAEFKKFRIDEGKNLEADLIGRVNSINDFLEKLAKYDEERLTTMRARLRNTIQTNIDAKLIDENRLEQELIYYFEKLDITEEKVRLKSHCNYFIDTLKEDSPGRKLAFISQEMGREINTIGSKANDINIQKSVVLMKDELEKIKEQLNNVL
jgi:uncharacterized protein (TIGR00255 family)